MAKKIKKALYRAITQLPHPKASDIWAMPVAKMQEHDYITRQSTQQERAFTPRRIMSLAATFACFFIVFFVGLNWYGDNVAISTVVDIDVNPSIEITANSKDKVLSVNALNVDGTQILQNKSYKGQSLEDTVEAITNELKANGYLSEAENAVLLTVNSNNALHSSQLAQSLSGKIQLTADRENTKTSVVRQTAAINEEINQLAKQHGVSVGKMRLVGELAPLFPQFTQEQLLQLPLEALTGLVNILGNNALANVAYDSSRFGQTQVDPPLPPTSTSKPVKEPQAKPEETPPPPPAVPTPPPPSTPPAAPVAPPPVVAPTPPPPAHTDDDGNNDDGNNDDNNDDDNGNNDDDDNGNDDDDDD